MRTILKSTTLTLALTMACALWSAPVSARSFTSQVATCDTREHPSEGSVTATCASQHIVTMNGKDTSYMVLTKEAFYPGALEAKGPSFKVRMDVYLLSDIFSSVGYAEFECNAREYLSKACNMEFKTKVPNLDLSWLPHWDTEDGGVFSFDVVPGTIIGLTGE